MENNSGCASWLNVHNRLHNRSIQNMVILGIIDSNQHGKNGFVQKKNWLKYINTKFTVHCITPQLTFHGMYKCPPFMS